MLGGRSRREGASFYVDWKRTLLLFPIALCFALLIAVEDAFLRALIIIPLILMGMLREIFLVQHHLEKGVKGRKN